MQIPFKQMFDWKTGNLALSAIGLWYLILPLLVNQAVNQTVMLFGMTFLSIALVRAKVPTVFGAVASMLIGMCYFFGLMTSVNAAILWSLSLVLFAVVVIFEIGLFKFGPSNVKAKVLTIVPMAMLGFNILLGVAGYNPMVTINFTTKPLIGLNFVCVMLVCWLNVFSYAGYEPLKKHTRLAINLLAVAAVALSIIGAAQGTLYQW